jgi:hypothetical protein
MPCKALPIWRMDVCKRIFLITGSFIKAFPAQGDVIDGRVDLQNDRLSSLFKQLQRPTAAVLSSQLWQNAQMLDIDKFLRFPAEKLPPSDGLLPSAG